MSRRRQSKEKSQRIHARRRAVERYGIEFGRSTESQILSVIQAGRSTVIERQSLRIVIHEVDLEDQTVRVVYDSKRHQIVTFLPKPELEQA